MATSRRRTAKKNLGQNLNELDQRLKRVERRPRSSLDSWSVTSDMLAPGLITLDKLHPSLLALLQQTYSGADATGDTAEEQGYGITDAIISSAEFSTNAANGKNSLFFQDTPPSEGTYLVDDIWYDTSPDTDGRPKYTPYQWDGDSWEPAPFGDGAFRFLNAGKIATGVLDAAAIVRVGQYPTPEGSSRLEISGGNGSIEFETELATAVTSSATTMTVTDASGLPGASVTFNLKIDSGTPDEELVLVTGRSGATLTVTRGVSGSAAAHDAGASVTYASTIYAGITVLKNPLGSGLTLDPADQAALPALFRLDASAGSLFLGEGDDYLKFNTADSPGRLSISGRLLVGIGAESVAIGPDISGDQDGIRLGPNNWWYRPGSTLEEFPAGGVFFRVGGQGNRLISAHTDGTIVVEGTVNPTEGQIKGRLSIRLPESDAADKFLIGRDVGTLSGLTGSEWDGIRLNSFNYFVLNNNASQTQFRLGDASEFLRFDSSVASGKLTLSGQLQAGTGTQSLLVGRNVAAGSRDGIQLGPVNFWYRPESVTGNNPVFQVNDGTPNPTFIRLDRNGKVRFSGEIEGSTSTGPITTPNDFRFGNNIVDGTKDGLRFNGNNFWLLPNDAIANGEEFFRIASGGPSSTTTYVSISKGGNVLIKGYHQGGVIEAPITTPPTPVSGEEMRLGADVSGNKDGLFLNANNYWYVPDSIDDGSPTIRVGGTTSFMLYDTLTSTLQVSGQITAATGNIGGWQINSTSLSSTGNPTYPITLLNDAANPKIYIGAGAHASTTTPFYADSTGKFSIGDKLFFDPADAQSFGTLTIIGRVRGAIDNVPIIPTDSGQFTANAVTVSGASPNQTAVVTTSAPHVFAVGDTVIVSGLTGNGAIANGAWQITAKTSTTFTIGGITGGVNGTYSGQSGTARVRELTLGLHPAYNGSPAGLGIRLDENNYWFVNNRFRVGTSGSYVSWDGATLETSGTIIAQGGQFTGDVRTTTGKVYAGTLGAARVELSSSGLYGYNAGGAATFGLSASDGSLFLANYLTVGSASNDVNTNATTSIQGNKIRTGVIESSTSLNPATGNTFSWDGTSTYSTGGMRIDLTTAQIITPGFRLTSTGSAFFAGDITAGRGTFRGSAPANVQTSASTSAPRVRATATNTTAPVTTPTVEIVKNTGDASSGYLSMYRPADLAQGVAFLVSQGEGGSGSNALLRAALEHGSATSEGFESGGLLRLIAYGTSDGNTPGRVRIQASDSLSSLVPGKIELKAGYLYFQEPKASTGIANLGGVQFVDRAGATLLAMDTADGRVGRGPRISYGTNTAANATSGWSPPAKNGDLHFQFA